MYSQFMSFSEIEFSKSMVVEPENLEDILYALADTRMMRTGSGERLIRVRLSHRDPGADQP